MNLMTKCELEKTRLNLNKENATPRNQTRDLKVLTLDEEDLSKLKGNNVV